MSEIEIAFGPGEEKLEAAWRRILLLEDAVLRLSQRSHIDRLVIAALLAEIPNPEAVRERWRQMVAGTYPDQVLRNQKVHLHQGPAQELRERTDFWTRAFEARCARRDDG